MASLRLLAPASWHLWRAAQWSNTMPNQASLAVTPNKKMTPVARMGRLLELDEAMDTFPIWSLGPAQMGKSYTPVQEPLRAEREAISYAVIIYSSLGMEEGAFTGVINIFGAQLCWGLLSTCQPTLPCLIRWSPILVISDGLSKKAHRLIGDITRVDGGPFILQFISTPRLFRGVWINLFFGCCQPKATPLLGAFYKLQTCIWLKTWNIQTLSMA